MNLQDTNFLKTVWLKEKPLIALFIFMSVFYSLLSIIRHLHFGTSTFDLGNFDQMVWHYSRLEAPSCTALGLHNGLGDHFSPILALCAPLFWIYPHAETLLAVQAFLLAITIIPVFLFSEKRIGRGPAYLMVLSFIFFWGIQHTVEYEFHPDVFAVPLIAFSIFFIDVKKWVCASISISLLLLVKEDLTVLVAFFGIYLFLNKKKALGISFILIGIFFFYLEVVVWVPYFHGTQGYYQHWLYNDFGSQPSDSLKSILKNPFLPFKVLFSNAEKPRTLLFLFMPFLFLPLYSELLILMIPLIAAKELSSAPELWGMIFHYSATLCPILVMAAADGLFNWRKKIFRVAPVKFSLSAPFFILIINFVLIPILSPWRYIDRAQFWHFSPMEKTSSLAFALIPPDASVAAQSSITPHLSNRNTIYSLGNNVDCHAIKPDFFVVNRNLSCWPTSYSEIQGCLDEKIKNGYKKIFESNGWIVLENERDKASFHD